MQLEQTSEEIRKGKQSYGHLAPSCQEHTVIDPKCFWKSQPTLHLSHEVHKGEGDIVVVQGPSVFSFETS